MLPFRCNVGNNIFAFAFLDIVLTEVAGIRQQGVNSAKAVWEVGEAFHRRSEFPFVIAVLADVVFNNEHGIYIN